MSANSVSQKTEARHFLQQDNDSKHISNTPHHEVLHEKQTLAFGKCPAVPNQG